MDRLPQQETRQPLLAGGADDQVRVRLTLGVQVVGDVLLGQRRRDILEAVASDGPLPQDVPHGVGDLLTAAVPHRDIDVHARVAVFRPIGALRAVFDSTGRLCGSSRRR